MWSALKYVASPWQQGRENTGFDKRVRKLSRRGGGGGQGTSFLTGWREREREKKLRSWRELQLLVSIAMWMQDKSRERQTERVKWKEKPRREDSERDQRKFLEHQEESVFNKGAVKGKVEESNTEKCGKRLNEDREMFSSDMDPQDLPLETATLRGTWKAHKKATVSELSLLLVRLVKLHNG